MPKINIKKNLLTSAGTLTPLILVEVTLVGGYFFGATGAIGGAIYATP